MITSLHSATLVAGYPVVVIYGQELDGTALAAALRSGGADARSLALAAVDDVLIRSASGRTGLVVLDMDLYRAGDAHADGGAHLVTILRARNWKVLVVGGDEDEAGIAAAVASGAIGAVPKSQPFHVLLESVVTAAAGMAVMTEVDRQRWLRRNRQQVADGRELALRLGRLSPREREVLALLASGMRAALIAERLVVSMPTVRTQIRSILTKLQVGSQLEAVALFRQHADPTGRTALVR